MTTRHFVSAADLTRPEVEALLEKAVALKADRRGPTPLERRSFALLFEKPSLRTRVSFEAGITQLGGAAIYLAPADINLGVRETVADVARNLERMVDGVIARTFAHATVTELAENSGVPVVNALSDHEHPCQALADLLTVHERKGLDSDPTLAYIGDGNNVCHSLMLLCETLGVPLRVGCPQGYEPDAALRDACPGTTVINDPKAAVDGADAVYTDVWASMGQEHSAAERQGVFAPFQVNAALMAAAAPDALFLHCLPAHRGEEVTAEVIDGPQSVVFDQAENRMHAQKALLVMLLDG